MAGYWKGTATNRDRQLDAVALIDADGNAHWILTRDDESAGFLVYGNVCCSSRFADELSAKELGETRNRPAKLDAAVAGNALNGTIEFDDREYSVALTLAQEYNHGLTLQALAGVYASSTRSLLGDVSVTLTIDANGQVAGSYSNGCVCNGSAAIPDSVHNMVRLQIELANCRKGPGDSKRWNGAYTGLGVLLPESGIFYHSVIGPAWLGPQRVSK